jgi:hypothetical protein
MASMDFLRDVLRGHKRLLKLNAVKFLLGLEKFHELTIANLLEVARAQVPQVFDYLPDNYIISRLSREYVMNVPVRLTQVMNTLGQGIVEQLRITAINRAKASPTAQREEMIELKAEFRDLINNPLFPLGRQCG